jgi:hypothetical protein
MGLPNIQLYSSSSLINAVWEVTPGYSSYALYSSPTGLTGTYQVSSIEVVTAMPDVSSRLAGRLYFLLG